MSQRLAFFHAADALLKAFQQLAGHFLIILHIQIMRIQAGQFQHEQLRSLFPLSCLIQALARLLQDLAIGRHYCCPASLAC